MKKNPERDRFYNVVFWAFVILAVIYGSIHYYQEFDETMACAKKGLHRVKTTFSYVCTHLVTEQDIDELGKLIESQERKKKAESENPSDKDQGSKGRKGSLDKVRDAPSGHLQRGT